MRLGVPSAKRCFFYVLLFLEERIAVILGRVEVFLDASHGDPTQQVGVGTGFVVGAGAAGAAEGLLTHDGAGGLVVDVEVAGCLLQAPGHHVDLVTILREDGTCQSVDGGVVQDVEGLFHLVLIVYINGDDGTEQLFFHGIVVRIGGLDDGRVDVIAFRLVVLAPDDDLGFLVLLGAVNGSGMLLKGCLVDHGVDKVGEVLGRSHLDALHIFLHGFYDLVGQVAGQVNP